MEGVPVDPQHLRSGASAMKEASTVTASSLVAITLSSQIAFADLDAEAFNAEEGSATQCVMVDSIKQWGIVVDVNSMRTCFELAESYAYAGNTTATVKFIFVTVMDKGKRVATFSCIKYGCEDLVQLEP